MIYNCYVETLMCGRPNHQGDFKLWACSLNSFINLFICPSLSVSVSKVYITMYGMYGMVWYVYLQGIVFDRGK